MLDNFLPRAQMLSLLSLLAGRSIEQHNLGDPELLPGIFRRLEVILDDETKTNRYYQLAHRLFNLHEEIRHTELTLLERCMQLYRHPVAEVPYSVLLGYVLIAVLVGSLVVDLGRYTEFFNQVMGDTFSEVPVVGDILSVAPAIGYLSSVLPFILVHVYLFNEIMFQLFNEIDPFDFWSQVHRHGLLSAFGVSSVLAYGSCLAIAAVRPYRDWPAIQLSPSHRDRFKQAHLDFAEQIITQGPLNIAERGVMLSTSQGPLWIDARGDVGCTSAPATSVLTILCLALLCHGACVSASGSVSYHGEPFDIEKSELTVIYYSIRHLFTTRHIPEQAVIATNPELSLTNAHMTLFREKFAPEFTSPPLLDLPAVAAPSLS